MSDLDRIPSLIGRLYDIVDELERLFPGRKFTPDGHLVGSIGEVIAAYRYDLELLPGVAETHDAKATDGSLVQIKATQVSRIGISSEPEHLLVLKLGRDGSATEVYNGPGSIAWKAAGKMQKTGQRPLSLSKLRKLMVSVDADERLPEANRND